MTELQVIKGKTLFKGVGEGGGRGARAPPPTFKSGGGGGAQVGLCPPPPLLGRANVRISLFAHIL